MGLTAAGAALMLASSSLISWGQASEPTAAGFWEKLNSSGKPEGWFRLTERSGVYEGQLVKVFSNSGEDPASWRCTKCEGEQKDAPVLGITMIKGMRRQGLTYENGSILDPRDGSIYKARMELSPDGGTLSVGGDLGISLLGRTEVWKRLPDTAMESARPASQGGNDKGPAKKSGTTVRPSASSM